MTMKYIIALLTTVMVIGMTGAALDFGQVAENMVAGTSYVIDHDPSADFSSDQTPLIATYTINDRDGNFVGCMAICEFASKSDATSVAAQIRDSGDVIVYTFVDDEGNHRVVTQDSIGEYTFVYGKTSIQYGASDGQLTDKLMEAIGATPA